MEILHKGIVRETRNGMVADDRRIRIITGHYGSGKTEFAVNYVKKLRESVDGRVAIADLDIVNVYFRSREKKEELEEKGIQVIASNLDTAVADVPAVSGAMTMLSSIRNISMW